jgi:transposase-like protein
MEMHQVRYFLALCEERNFTRAAKHCGVAQPSLTRAIKRLEEELSGSLFDRDRVTTRLTELGILVRPELARIEQSVAEAKRKAAKFLAARTVKPQPRTMEVFMRAHHAIAVVAVILIGFGVKLFFFSAPAAEADIHAIPSASMNILQMHINHPNKNDHPVQKMHDMSFVFSEPN